MNDERVPQIVDLLHEAPFDRLRVTTWRDQGDNVARSG